MLHTKIIIINKNKIKLFLIAHYLRSLLKLVCNPRNATTDFGSPHAKYLKKSYLKWSARNFEIFLI
jgi:hypothetical protein